MIEYDKNDPTVVYIDGKPYPRAEHEEIVMEFAPREGEDFDVLKHPAFLTEEEKANLTPRQKMFYDTKRPDFYRKNVNDNKDE